MDTTIYTPRLKLTPITHAERGSHELEWIHSIRSNAESMLWSITPMSKTIEDTERMVGMYVSDPGEEEEEDEREEEDEEGSAEVPGSQTGGERESEKGGESATNNSGADDAAQQTKEKKNKTFKLTYAVHLLHPPSPLPTSTNPSSTSAETFIGLLTLTSLPPNHLTLPSHLSLPASEEPRTLVLELGYAFLPQAWGRGFATESVGALLRAVGVGVGVGKGWEMDTVGTGRGMATPASARSEGTSTPLSRLLNAPHPYKKIYIRAIVNSRNPASLKVMRRSGLEERGVYDWTGEPIFVGGEWRVRDDLVVFGGWVGE